MRSVLTKLFYGLIYSAPVTLLTLAACGGGGGGGAAIIESLLGGTTSGLTSNGLVLQNNGADNLTVSGATSGVTGFTFSQKVVEGDTYNISVFAQPSTPTRQNCAVTAGASGVMPATNLNSVAVDCVDVFGVRVAVRNSNHDGLKLVNTYTLSGEAQAHSEVLAVSAVGLTVTRTVEFNTLLPENASYDVTVDTHPTAETCSFQSTASSVSATEVSGVIPTSDVTFNLTCA